MNSTDMIQGSTIKNGRGFVLIITAVPQTVKTSSKTRAGCSGLHRV